MYCTSIYIPRWVLYVEKVPQSVVYHIASESIAICMQIDRQSFLGVFRHSTPPGECISD